MNTRGRLQRALVAAWQKRGVYARLALPLAWLHAAWRRCNRWSYRTGLRRAERLPVPVIVVGNLYVGGTGKTPLTIELVRALAARGRHPGIVSRGYGAAGATPRQVDPRGPASAYGDEPLVMAQATGVPVVVGRDRVAAARLLLNLHPACNVIVADDGLQHLRLARDFEIAIIHARGLGNGWLLPAGPLRDPPERLDGVDAVVLHGDTPTVRVYSPFYRMTTDLGDAHAVALPGQRIELAALAAQQRTQGLKIVAAAGIGMPDRFFAMLRARGLDITEIPLHDHFDFRSNPFLGAKTDRILVTEKDAVKCRDHPHLAHDARVWAVTLRTEVDPQLFDLIEKRLKAHGSPLA